MQLAGLNICSIKPRSSSDRVTVARVSTDDHNLVSGNWNDSQEAGRYRSSVAVMSGNTRRISTASLPNQSVL